MVPKSLNRFLEEIMRLVTGYSAACGTVVCMSLRSSVQARALIAESVWEPVRRSAAT